MENLINFYLGMSAVIFICLSIIWQKSSNLNLAFKTTFIVMSIIGVLVVLTTSGFVIKT